MQTLDIIKIGGNILDDQLALAQFLRDFASIEGQKILVHGGGKIATSLGQKMGITEHLIDGRRITDKATLDLVTMVYAGLLNKNIVASLQAHGCNSLGLTGADGNIMTAAKRPALPLDYGFVGDPDPLQSASPLYALMNVGYSLIVAPITHDGKGQLLNTNADTIASVLAIMSGARYDVRLYYCFEKKGVLDHSGSVISELGFTEYKRLKLEGVISGGMIPKLDNAFNALAGRTGEVHILHASDLIDVIAGRQSSTKLINDE